MTIWQSPFKISLPAGVCCCCGCCLQKICSSAPSASPPSAPSAPKKKERKEKKSPLQPRWNQCALTFYSLDCNVFHISAVIRWTNKNPGAQTTTTGEKTHSSMTMLKTMIICHRLLLPLFPTYCFKNLQLKGYVYWFCTLLFIRHLKSLDVYFPQNFGAWEPIPKNVIIWSRVQKSGLIGLVELNLFLAIWWWSGHQGWYTERR